MSGRGREVSPAFGTQHHAATKYADRSNVRPQCLTTQYHGTTYRCSGRGPNPSTSLPRVGGEAERFRAIACNTDLTGMTQ